MWFILWTFGVFIIGIIPILSYIMPNVFYSLPVSFDTVKTSDLAIMGLAFNWTNFNETFNIMANKHKDGLYKISKSGSIIILMSSLFLTFVLFCILYQLNLQEIMEKQCVGRNVMEMDDNIIRVCTIVIGIFSFILNIIFIWILKHK